MLSFTTFLAVLFAAGQLISLVHGHMDMKSPTPFRSKFIVPNAPNTDFSMTSPLLEDGSDFPCKGYQNDDLANVATLTAGSNLEVEFDGSASHNGGSCQFSLSYDGGKNWIVIYSIMGGCPLSPNYTVPIPAGVPSADRALLAWSWENHTGNREFYMNCAPVAVAGKAGATFTGPKMHQANVFGAGTCNTVEGIDTVYPNPGPFVLLGGTYATSGLGPVTTLANCPFDENVNLSTSGSTVSSSAGSGTSSNSTGTGSGTGSGTAPSSSPSVVNVPPIQRPAVAGNSSAVTSTSTVIATTTVDDSSAATAAAVDPPADPPAPTAAVAPVPLGTAVSNTTNTDAGQAGSSCPTDGAVVCSSDGQSFYMCDHGALVAMGSVAAGTSCSNGQITRKRSIPPQLHRRVNGHKGFF